MTEREKLIEILSTKIHPREGVDPAAVAADFLLDHDVLPVVRCRDCAKRGETEFGARYCREPMGMIGQIPVAEDFFCGGGEPRGNAR